MKTLVLGLDGLDLEIAEQVSLPNLEALGKMNLMRSTIPPISQAAWSSISYGANPGHFGFVYHQAINGQFFWDMLKISRLQPIWNSFRHPIIFNNPALAIPEPHGVQVAGWLNPPNVQYAQPDWVFKDLQKRNYIGPPPRDFKKAEKTFEKRVDIFLYLEKEYRKIHDWDFAFPCFCETDQMAHFRMQDIQPFYEQVDKAVGRILAQCEPDKVYVVSDHGSDWATGQVHMPVFLQRFGFQDDAYISGPDVGIYLRKPKAKDAIVGKLEELGAKVYFKEDIYHGPFLRLLPDLVPAFDDFLKPAVPWGIDKLIHPKHTRGGRYDLVKTGSHRLHGICIGADPKGVECFKGAVLGGDELDTRMEEQGCGCPKTRKEA